MKKTLKLIEKAYSLLEAAPFPDAGADAPADTPTGGDEGAAPPADADATASPPAPEPQKTQELTSQAEVNMMQLVVDLLQAVVTAKIDSGTQSMIVNFDKKSITPENAKQTFANFQKMFLSQKSDLETTKIDNQHGL
jgi:hypothetical protein